MISMVLRNIQNSFINFRKIFILLIVSQIISIMSIFFVYGIYGSYAAKDAGNRAKYIQNRYRF